MPEFCNPRSPAIQSVPTAQGGVEVQLMPSHTNEFDPQDIVTAHIQRGMPVMDPNIVGLRVRFPTPVLNPMELFVYDLLVPDALFGEPRTEVGVYDAVDDAYPMLNRPESDRLTLSETIGSLGRGLPPSPSAAMPRYQEMIKHALTRVGWDASSFRAYRCLVEYPVVGISIVLHFDFPPRAD